MPSARSPYLSKKKDLLRKSSKNSTPKPSIKKSQKWQNDLEDLEAIQEPKPKTYTSHATLETVRCPHCSRSFIKQDAEKHIPVCSKVLTKPVVEKVNMVRFFTPGEQISR
jgi:hypothetical protein